MNNYIPRFNNNTHDGDEERMWARTLSEGNAAKSMSLLFVQKLCAATHEFEAGFEKNIFNKNS